MSKDHCGRWWDLHWSMNDLDAIGNLADRNADASCEASLSQAAERARIRSAAPSSRTADLLRSMVPADGSAAQPPPQTGTPKSLGSEESFEDFLMCGFAGVDAGIGNGEHNARCCFQSVVSRLCNDRRLPRGIASMALPIRLLRTCRISPPKPDSGTGSPPGVHLALASPLRSWAPHPWLR